MSTVLATIRGEKEDFVEYVQDRTNKNGLCSCKNTRSAEVYRQKRCTL